MFRPAGDYATNVLPPNYQVSSSPIVLYCLLASVSPPRHLKVCLSKHYGIESMVSLCQRWGHILLFHFSQRNDLSSPTSCICHVTLPIEQWFPIHGSQPFGQLSIQSVCGKMGSQVSPRSGIDPSWVSRWRDRGGHWKEWWGRFDEWLSRLFQIHLATLNPVHTQTIHVHQKPHKSTCLRMPTANNCHLPHFKPGCRGILTP